MKEHDSTKQRILLAAGPIFAKKGFRAATVREISDSAGVNLASINYYFGDKHQLYLDTVVNARKMRARQVPSPKWEPGISAEQKLQDYVSLLLNRIVALQTAPWQVRLLMREVLQPTDACRKLVRDYFKPFLEELMLIVDEIVEFQLPPERRLQLAFSIVGQCMYYRFAGDIATMIIEDESVENEFDIDHLASHITDFSLGALLHIKNKARRESTSSAPKATRD